MEATGLEPVETIQKYSKYNGYKRFKMITFAYFLITSTKKIKKEISARVRKRVNLQRFIFFT